VASVTAGYAIPRGNVVRSIRRSKYRNMRVIVDGLKFQSKREAKAWCDLKHRERAGEISELRRQVPYQLYASTECGGIVAPICKYVADFVFIDNRTRETVVADAKGGCITPMFRLKQKMMRICYGIEVVII
jgi:hypothetical protein